MAIYYVKNGGNNSNTGLSDEQAWETISKVNGFTFAAGDTVSFKCGSTWRETLTIPRSGSVGNHMIYNSYSTGNKPRLLGSIQATTWTAEGHSNIWQSATSIPVNPWSIGDGIEVFFEETDQSYSWGTHQTYTSDFANLTEEYDWTWNSNTLYVYSTTDPDSVYDAIEAAQVGNIIYLNDKEYITIDGFELAYGMSGVQERYPTQDYTGLTIKNCFIHHLGRKDYGGYGVHVCYNDTLLEYNETRDCGRRGLCVYHYGDYDISNIIVRYNTCYNGYHTTGLDLSVASIGTAGDLEYVYVYNNYVYDPSDADASVASVSMYIDGSGSGTGKLRYLWFYNNIMAWTTANALRLSEVYTAYVYNNTFYEHNVNLGAAFLAIDYGESIVVKNNVFYTTFPNETNVHGHSIQTSFISEAEIDTNYNLVYRTSSADHVIYSIDGVSYSMNEWDDIQTDFSWELNSPTPDNPDFVSTTNWHLQAGSPAIGTGIYLNGLVDYDYEGNLRNNPPSIGAYEYNPPAALHIQNPFIHSIHVNS